MKIAYRFGHLLNTDQGANGIISEFSFDREYGPYVAEYLAIDGNQVLNCTPSSATSMADSLSQGVSKANNWGADYFVSCHGDAFNGSAKGDEVIAGSQAGVDIGNRICAKISALGFTNRGAYIDVRGLYEIHQTHMVANIVEPLFVDNTDDVSLYKKIGPRALGKAIAEGIVGHTIAELVKPATPSIPLASYSDKYKDLQGLLNANHILDKYGHSLATDGQPGECTLSAVSKATIYPGDKNSFVTWLQKYFNISADGIYSRPGDSIHTLYDCITKFQKDHGLTVDGIVGPNTWKVILGLA